MFLFGLLYGGLCYKKCGKFVVGVGAVRGARRKNSWSWRGSSHGRGSGVSIIVGLFINIAYAMTSKTTTLTHE